MAGRRRQSAATRTPRDRFASVKRHAEPGWYEWAVREFVRYMFLLGVLAVLVMVPLQMAASWLPGGRPPVVDPEFVVAFAVAFDASAMYLSLLAYRFLWHPGGYVDGAVARHESPEDSDAD